MSEDEAHALMRAAIGRLFRLGSRAEQPGDAEQFAKIRSAVLDAGDALGLGQGHQPQHAAPTLARFNAKYGTT